jgi:ribonuclease P protein component
MKSKIVSLSKNEDFKNLLKGKKCSNKYFTLFFKKLNNKNNKNLNISFVTKKKLGNAVKRNKIKRRLKNMTNESVKKNLINFNYSYLVIAKNTVFNDDYSSIKKTLFLDFERIK